MPSKIKSLIQLRKTSVKISIHKRGFGLVFGLALITAFCVPAHAQDWRLSAGYTTERYGLEITPNDGFLGEIGFTQKGLIEAELERYLLYRLYLSLKGDLLIHNQESIFLGGPINFNRSSLGLNIGVQWDKFGLYAGAHGSYTWDLAFKGVSTDENDHSEYWIDAGSASHLWSGGVTFGAKYYLLSFLRLHAEFRTHNQQQNSLSPAADSPYIPKAAEVQFTPYSFSAGISISIPWHSRKKLERINSPASPVPLMGVRGVQFESPVDNKTLITSQFGNRWGRPHEGIDIEASRGDKILAAADGIVEETSTTASYGRKIVLRHGAAFTTTYAHLNKIRVRKGDRVRKGQVIGTAGNSGNANGVHLHFELRQNGHPVDPQRYIRF